MIAGSYSLELRRTYEAMQRAGEVLGYAPEPSNPNLTVLVACDLRVSLAVAEAWILAAVNSVLREEGLPLVGEAFA